MPEAVSWTDGAGRTQRVTDDPVTTGPRHEWQGDALGHNCEGCPRESVWRCDVLAHEVKGFADADA